ncbi:hypothetical protein ACQR1I_19705 [Bradyrhizobium sp. HKCCYLS2038]|uniref:hypothetical protein n=1 Tax=Bradyrhizobium sp. HKCCYLS2038 TaxID=3420764 RepID=UPI003EBCA1F1
MFFIKDKWDGKRLFPPLNCSEEQIDLCFSEVEAEDFRTRAGSGRTEIAGALSIPQRQLKEMQTAVARYTPDFDLRFSWYIGFRSEQFAFPASRVIPADHPIIAPWVRQLTVQSIELTLVETCCDPIELGNTTQRAKAEDLLAQYWAAPKKVAYSTILQT